MGVSLLPEWAHHFKHRNTIGKLTPRKRMKWEQQMKMISSQMKQAATATLMKVKLTSVKFKSLSKYQESYHSSLISSRRKNQRKRILLKLIGRLIEYLMTQENQIGLKKLITIWWCQLKLALSWDKPQWQPLSLDSHSLNLWKRSLKSPSFPHQRLKLQDWTNYHARSYRQYLLVISPQVMLQEAKSSQTSTKAWMVMNVQCQRYSQTLHKLMMTVFKEVRASWDQAQLNLTVQKCFQCLIVRWRAL